MIVRQHLVPAALLALFIALVASCWVGFIGSDDVTFARGAYGWIEHFPYVGGHGTIRYPLTVPMALSFSLLGENEVAMVLPSLACFVLAFALAWRVARYAAGSAPANLALLLLATLPLFVIQGSIANVDAPELAFLLASFALFWRATEERASAVRLLGAGAFAGLAFLTRETAIFAAVFYAPLFLIGYRLNRLRYLLVAAGFLGVWAIELAYLWVMTGDPFYRFTIALHHDSTIDRSIDLAGNTIVHPLVDPVLVLLLNQEFMALFVLAIPLGLWLCLARGVPTARQRLARLLGWLGLSWFLCAGAAQSLLPLNPRYFTVTAAVACVLAALALWTLAERGGRWRLAAALAVLGLLGTNALGLVVENKNPLYGERVLATIARGTTEPVHTDPSTRYRADLLLRWEGAQARIKATPPPPGALYFHNPARTERADARLPAAQLPAFQPRQEWRVVSHYALPQPLPARLLVATGLDRMLPGAVWARLNRTHPPVTLYRLPGHPTPASAAH